MRAQEQDSFCQGSGRCRASLPQPVALHRSFICTLLALLQTQPIASCDCPSSCLSVPKCFLSLPLSVQMDPLGERLLIKPDEEKQVRESLPSLKGALHH